MSSAAFSVNFSGFMSAIRGDSGGLVLSELSLDTSTDAGMARASGTGMLRFWLISDTDLALRGGSNVPSLSVGLL